MSLETFWILKTTLIIATVIHIQETKLYESLVPYRIHVEETFKHPKHKQDRNTIRV